MQGKWQVLFYRWSWKIIDTTQSKTKLGVISPVTKFLFKLSGMETSVVLKKKNRKLHLLILLFSSFESDWICPAAAKDSHWENQTAWTEEQGMGTDLVLISNLKKPIPINFIHDGVFLLQP